MNQNKPQIVTFYSFKGGHGRTTSLVNVANLCARFGHSVLCIDLDLEAPGLAGLYELELETPGFVEYAAAIRAGETPSFSPIEVEVEPVGDGRPGRLFVMPAGRFAGVSRDHSKQYWSFMAQDAQDVFSASPAADDFWTTVRNAVSGHEAAFDYVFVDLRSGFSPLSLVGLRQWEGSLAMFLSRHKESSQGTRLLLDLLPENFFRSQDHDRVCVLTRRPRFLTETEFAREHFHVPAQGRRAASTMYDPEWLQHVVDIGKATRVVMRADPEIEAFGYRIINPTGRVINRPLLDDYLELASRLIPAIFPNSDGGKLNGRILLESVLAPPTDLKVFRRSDKGDFVNFGDMQPNIAFKVETLQNLLDHLCSEINGELNASMANDSRDKGEPARTRAADVLFTAGWSSGKSFGSALRRDILGDRPQGGGPSDEDLIAQWCEFDSSTGWARLSMEPKKDSRHNRIAWCTIRAELNAFGRRSLADPQPGVTEQDLCHFLKGYIGGVLDGLVSATTQVVHQTRHCMYHDRSLDLCRFLIVNTLNADIRHPELMGPADERQEPLMGTESVNHLPTKGI